MFMKKTGGDYHSINEIVDSVSYHIQINRLLDGYLLLSIGLIPVYVPVVPVDISFKEEESEKA
jgi:hypothetical protein